MRDFVGNEVHVGDEVVCIELNYKNLVRGTVVKLTPKAMQVRWKRWGREEVMLRYSNQVVKV